MNASWEPNAGARPIRGAAPRSAGPRTGVWTDAYPDVVRGDVNGNGLPDNQDQSLILEFIAAADGGDTRIDGSVELANFATNFSVYDINHNGIVDGIDVLLVSIPGDTDGDDDVDLADFARLAACHSGEGTPFAFAQCALADFDADMDVDPTDASRFYVALTGPGGE